MAYKRQPDHQCPICKRFSRCSREANHPPCPVPQQIMCGSCGLERDRRRAKKIRKGGRMT